VSLNLQAVGDSATDQNLRQIGQRFPIQQRDIAEGAVGSAQIEAGAVTDDKLASPIIRGQVKSGGGVELGSGFTSEKTAEGRYTIKLTNELPTTGIMTMTLVAAAGTYRIATQGKKEFKVETTNSAFAFADAAFNFTVVAS
jgi:hypothetical protein